MKNRNMFTDMENKCVVTRGEAGWRAVLQINRQKLLHVKLINKDHTV